MNTMPLSLHKYLIVILYLFTISYPSNGQTNQDKKARENEISLMSFNIKFASPTFKPEWDVRKVMQVDLIEKYNPDIICTQEGLKKQVDYLMTHLPAYTVIGEGRKGGDDDEHMAIFFKRDKFRLREMGSFQLSNTPEVIGSGPGVNPRMVTWARLAYINISEDDEKNYPMDYRGHWENTQEFYVLNTHFFDRSDQSMARENAAKLIMEWVKSLERFGEWTKERPIFVLGDFNARPDSEVYKIFVDGKGILDPLDFKDSIEGGKGIDWVLYKGNINVLHYEKVDYNVNGEYPSDHKPVFVKMKIKE